MGNPYPSSIVDEATGLEVSNQRHIDWQDGYVIGFENGWQRGFRAAREILQGVIEKRKMIRKLERKNRT